MWKLLKNNLTVRNFNACTWCNQRSGEHMQVDERDGVEEFSLNQRLPGLPFSFCIIETVGVERHVFWILYSPQEEIWSFETIKARRFLFTFLCRKTRRTSMFCLVHFRYNWWIFILKSFYFSLLKVCYY